MNDWDVEAESFAAREISHRSALDPDALESAARLLAGARRPAIVAGPGVARAGAFYDAVALAEKMRAEVWAAPNSPLVGFPEDHPLFKGHLVLAQKGLAEQLSPYDVVLVLGAQVFQYYPYVPGPVVEEGTRLVQVTEDFEEANRAATGTSLVGDVGVAIRQLIELLPQTERQAPSAPEKPPVPEPSSPISVEYLMYVLSKVLPEDAMVADESASSKAKLHRHVRPSRPGGYLTSAAGASDTACPLPSGSSSPNPSVRWSA
jgi:benzoylformate decarboxylase